MPDSRVPDVTAYSSPPRRDLDDRDIEMGEQLGRGGQAIVTAGRLPDDRPPDRVAIKEPLQPETLAKTAVETFLDEAATWATVDTREREKRRWVDSEFIVGVIDTGDKLPWIAMEYMDGGDLDARLDEAPDGLDRAEALWIGECVCRGVELAHNYGIAHLDLKPANVLFRDTGPSTWNLPKVADWGLARVLAEESGSMEALSVEYAAPEQFEAERFGDPDMLTDV